MTDKDTPDGETVNRARELLSELEASDTDPDISLTDVPERDQKVLEELVSN